MRPRWRANSASGASSCRRIPACCRRRACSPRRSSTRVAVGLSAAARGPRLVARWHGRSPTWTQACAKLMAERGRAAAHDRTILYFADVCYVGQSYHLEVPLQPMPPTRSRRSTGTSSRRTTASTATAPRARPASSTCAPSTGARVGRPATAATVPRARRQRAQGQRATSSPPEAADSSPAASTIGRDARPGSSIRRPGDRRAGRHDDLDRAGLAWRRSCADGNLIITAD